MDINLYGLGDYSARQVRELALGVERQELDPTPIYYRRPDAAPEPRAFAHAMPLPETRYLVPDAFAGATGADIAGALTIEALREIGMNGDPYLKEAVRIALERAAAVHPEDADLQLRKRYLNLSPAWQV